MAKTIILGGGFAGLFTALHLFHHNYYNLNAIAQGKSVKTAKVSLRGSMMKLGIEASVANIFDRFEVTGRPGHLIREGTYLQLLPTPIHDFKVTTDWVADEIFTKHS